MSSVASDASVEAAVKKLVEELDSSTMRHLETDEDAGIPEASLDGRPSDEQCAVIQTRIDEALKLKGLHAMLLIVPTDNGHWSIGIISLIGPI